MKEQIAQTEVWAQESQTYTQEIHDNRSVDVSNKRPNLCTRAHLTKMW
jgi:hypothetical protein